MRIECPGCEAAYEVPEAQIRPGRSVRCARCALQWQPAGESVPMALSEAAEADAPVDADATAADPPSGSLAQGSALPSGGLPGTASGPRRAATPQPVVAAAAGGPPRPSRELAAWSAGWVLSVIVLAGLLLSAAHWRHAVMRGWPPSIRLYTALGASPPG